MPAIPSTEFKKKLDRLISSFATKVYVKDDNGKWIDFTTRVSNVGKDSLLRMGTISHVAEKDLFGFHTTLQSIKMDNSDGFWNQPVPSTLKAVDGSAASFPRSKNSQQSVYYKHELKVAIQLVLNDGRIEEGNAGIFLINTIAVNTDGTASIGLMGLAKPLMERDASKVKDGRSWYINKPIWFLIRELLKTEYAGVGGELPDTFVLPSVVEIDTANDERALSHYGRPPEWDGSSWRNDGFYTRAICCCQVSGDSKKYLYLGCDEQLWKWDSATDTYTYLGTVTPSGYYIRRLWFNSNDNYLWGVAYPDPLSTSKVSGMKIFSWNGTVLSVKAPTDTDGSLSKVFPGDFCYRDGLSQAFDSLHTGRIVGQSQGADAGENVPFPYRQYVRSVNASVFDETGMVEVAEIWTEANVQTGQDYIPRNAESKTYGVPWGVKFNSLVDPGPLAFRFTFNQQGAIGFSASQNLVIYGVFDSGSYKLYKYNCSTNTCTAISGYPNSAYQPTALDCQVGSGQYMWIAFMEWKDSGTDISVPKFYQIHLPTSAWVDKSSLLTSNYMTVIEICAMSLFAEGLLVEFDRNIMNYKLRRGFDVAMITEHEGSYQYSGLVYSSSDTYIYFVREGIGQLGRIKHDGTDFGILGDGESFVEGDNFLEAELVLDETDSNNIIVYGISSPYILIESQEISPQGKCYLWKFSKQRSDRIELADFENMTVWKALLLLAQVANYTMGFDTAGNFYFVSRSDVESSASLILGQTISDDRLASLSYGTGEKEVFNFCQVTPNIVKLQDLKSEIRMLKRDITLAFIPFSIDQRDLLTKRIKAICTQRGKTDDGKGRFKYLIYDTVIDANFRQDVGAADVTLYLHSVYGGESDDKGIHAGDFIVVTNPNTGADITKEVESVSESANSVTIPTGGLGIALNKNDECRFIRKNVIDSSHGSSDWSDEGVTYTTEASGTGDRTVAVNSVANLSIGTIVLLDSEERRIESIDADASPNPTITVDSAGGNWAVDHANGTIIYAWFSPNANDKPFEIGGSNVFVKFTSPTGGTEDTDWTKSFIEGDVLSIICPGLKLEQDEHSKRSTYNSLSVEKYGKRQYPSISNKFIGRGMARDICQRVVNTYKDPVFGIKAESVFLPYAGFLTVNNKLTKVAVRSHVLFPNAVNFTVDCTVKRIDHTPPSCKTVFHLRAMNPY